MTEYYYTPNPDVEHAKQNWNFELLGNQLTFATDNGVFSKRTVDYGSRVLINSVEIAELPDGDILDLGCGYGPIGLALAKRYSDRHFLMSDVNNRALGLAKENAQQNHIANVTIQNSDGYQAIDATFAAVITNPPVRAGKTVVDNMITGALEHLISGGRLTVVLQKKQGAPSAKKLMANTFGNCKVIKRDKGYYILESTKH
ncbi:class I SAM-dependent methyltransferase [Nicoliella spurrieriana]|uniref:Class I SAM-dependent methyltransferase n=1 Tax=Nicoliella spurrieriana TaxID=2925830 RepID=A0A976RSX7_9LACO|nr:class I SAM-dependent methyltransferase [Nicoliella spurrieriana]UQS87006.1 class I SAM-dependent methyltransferase [Nicoliella spurrieriana]